MNNVVVAPVYDTEPADLSLSKRGNTARGLPSGPQIYGGAPLDGAGYTAQLFGGSPHAASANLQPLSPPVSFRRENYAGFVVSPFFTVTVPGVAEPQAAKIQLRAWNNAGGVITNWLLALATPSVRRGESWPFISPPLGGAFHAPPNLIGLESFNLATGALQRLEIKINFQTNGAMVPAGYLSDTGLPFGKRLGDFTYGWNADLSEHAHARRAANSPDERHDTFIEMQRMPGAFWEIAVSNGVYGVHIAAGDPLNLDGVYRIEAKGRLVVHGTPTARQRWIEGDALVEVTDGRLTLTSDDGAYNNRLCFVEIARIDAPKIEIVRRGAPLKAAVELNFEGEVGFKYQVERSTDFVAWIPQGLAIHQRGARFAFDDDIAPMTSQRFYRTRTLISTAAALVYSNPFESAIGPEWSSTNTAVTPTGTRRFLGPFGRSAVSLSLSDLPPHTKARIAFDLFVIGSWDGNDLSSGPDTWGLAVSNGPVLMHTTFSAVSDDPASQQAYPGSHVGSSFLSATGAAEIETLGYGPAGDTVYRLAYTFAHSAEELQFNILGGTSESLADESWGLDNVSVWLTDDPYH